MRWMIWLIAALIPGVANAADRIDLDSKVFVERITTDAKGKPRAVLEAPKIVTPGDRLVFVLSYRNAGPRPADDFVVTNPLPGAVAYQGTPDETAQVSVDGGKSWGPLAALRVREPDGDVRHARPEDVTHIRWAMRRAVPAGGEGRLSFRGIVR